MFEKASFDMIIPVTYAGVDNALWLTGICVGSVCFALQSNKPN